MEICLNQVLVGSVVFGLFVVIVLFMVWLLGVLGSNIKIYDIFFK